jgi:hypothetical protein
MYENIFHGHCYSWRNLVHKAIHCKINARNDYVKNINDYGYPRNNHVNSRSGNAYGYVNKNYNPFDPLMDQNIICYKCNNLGHKAQDCTDMKEYSHIIKPAIVWRRKENPNQEDFRIALIVEDKEEEDEWCIDSGCSTHMTGDRNKLINLNKKGGSVAFGDDSSVKILEKGVLNLGSENVKAENVILVEDMKHNLLNIGKIFDQGYTLMFDSQKCETGEETQEDWLQ